MAVDEEEEEEGSEQWTPVCQIPRLEQREDDGEV